LVETLKMEGPVLLKDGSDLKMLAAHRKDRKPQLCHRNRLQWIKD